MKKLYEKLWKEKDNLDKQTNIAISIVSQYAVNDDRLDDMLLDIRRYLEKEPFAKVIVLSVGYHMYLEYDQSNSIKILEELLKLVNHDLFSMEYRLYVYWNVAYYNFVRTYNHISWEVEYSVYELLYNGFVDKIREKYQPYEANNDLIVVTSREFIPGGHAPTRNTLDHCRILQKMGKEVLLIVTGETSVQGEGFIGGVRANGMNLKGEQIIRYMDVVIKAIGVDSDKYTEYSMYELVDEIYKKKPVLVYNIGARNLITDACQLFTKTVTLPCAMDIPITKSEYIITPKSIVEETDKERIQFYKKKGQQFIESVFTFKLEEVVTKRSKVHYGINEDTVVIAIIGTRLDVEMSAEFIEILNCILKLDHKVQYIFMGNFGQYEELLESHEEIKECSSYIGMQTDLRGTLGAVDIYLNPLRQGGGTSAVEALSMGVPVVTMPRCDVAWICREPFICKDKEDYVERTKQYIEDKELYVAHQKIGLERVKELLDTKGVLQKRLEQLEVY